MEETNSPVQPKICLKKDTSRSPRSRRTRPARSKSLGHPLVNFSKIHIREYERTAGDNIPGDGVPMSLGWKYNEKDEMDLSEYDEVRRYRSYEELKLPNHTRMKILTKFGVSVDEQMEALEEAKEIRSSREASAANAPLDRAEYALEKAKKKYKNFGKRTPVKRAKEEFEEQLAKLIEQDRLRTGREPGQELGIRRRKSMD